MRNRREEEEQSLAGTLLLAHPALKDPNFRRTVVLLSGHDDEGAMGVVLNRPLGQTLGELDDLFADGPLARVPVFSGGPVQPERLLICALGFRDDAEGFRLHFGLEPEAAAALAEAQGESIRLRAFAGYAGWGSGQLENELEHDTWAVSPIPSDLLVFAQDETLWRGVLSRVGPEWRLLAAEPDEPELN